MADRNFYYSLKPYRRRMLVRVVGYFLKGLLVAVPLAVTGYIIYWLIEQIQNVFSIPYAWVGMLVAASVVLLLGYFSSGITKPFFDLFEGLLDRAPFIRLVYGSVKDITGAVVGDKRKFTEPVLVSEGAEGIYKVGFVTRHDLSKLDLEGYCAVYFPYSYAISGQMMVVRNDKVKPLKEGEAPEVLKFLISGGITGLD